mgnify:CR=1 FL=1
MRILRNITICLGVLALIASAPACGDSADNTDGSSENNETSGENAGEEEGSEEEGSEEEGSEEANSEENETEGTTNEEGESDAAESAETEGDATEASGPEDDASESTEAGEDTASTGGACINDADQAIIDDPDTDVTAVATDYAYACLTDEDIGTCAAAGVSNDTGLSNECAYCYAEQVVCAAENCLSQCIADSEAQGCVDCRNENCVPLFEPCSGIAASTDE